MTLVLDFVLEQKLWQETHRSYWKLFFGNKSSAFCIASGGRRSLSIQRIEASEKRYRGRQHKVGRTPASHACRRSGRFGTILTIRAAIDSLRRCIHSSRLFREVE
jgi:hypothetical protein